MNKPEQEKWWLRGVTWLSILPFVITIITWWASIETRLTVIKLQDDQRNSRIDKNEARIEIMDNTVRTIKEDFAVMTERIKQNNRYLEEVLNRLDKIK